MLIKMGKPVANFPVSKSHGKKKKSLWLRRLVSQETGLISKKGNRHLRK